MRSRALSGRVNDWSAGRCNISLPGGDPCGRPGGSRCDAHIDKCRGESYHDRYLGVIIVRAGAGQMPGGDPCGCPGGLHYPPTTNPLAKPYRVRAGLAPALVYHQSCVVCCLSIVPFPWPGLPLPWFIINPHLPRHFPLLTSTPLTVHSEVDIP